MDGMTINHIVSIDHGSYIHVSMYTIAMPIIVDDISGLILRRIPVFWAKNLHPKKRWILGLCREWLDFSSQQTGRQVRVSRFLQHIPSGYVKIAIEDGPVEIVDFHMKNGDCLDLSIVMLNYQRLSSYKSRISWGMIAPRLWALFGIPQGAQREVCDWWWKLPSFKSLWNLKQRDNYNIIYIYIIL